MCFKIYQLVPAKYLSSPGLAWQAALQKTKVKLKLPIDTDMLLMVEKEFIDINCHFINRYATANNEYMNDYDIKKRIVIS